MKLSRRNIQRAVVISIVVFAGLQLTNPARTNPQSDGAMALEVKEAVPANVARTLNVACGNCHSNRTEWPWYTHVAPVSWWTVGHVNEGRRELNFADWGTYGPRKRETRLHSMCELTQKRDMPLSSYAMIHADAKLSDQQISEICAWTEAALTSRAAK